jgi:transposase
VKKQTTAQESESLREDILRAHINGKLTVNESCERLGMSRSGFMKLQARYRARGQAALSHGLRGKPPNRKPHPRKTKAVDLATGKYKDFTISHTSELLEQREGLRINPATLRRWLNAAGRPVAKRKNRHRKRREPKQFFGEMLQMDGSFHDWFGDANPVCMINLADDSTGTCMLHFDGRETIEAACRVMWRWLRKHGVPKSVYADERNLYHLKARGPDNFFNTMCRQLGIATIRAFSPQAKGRVERANGTHQTRLVPLIRHDGVRTIAQLNDYVAGGYEAGHNKRFARTAPGGDCHRPLPARFKTIDDVCWIQSERVVNNDWTVKYKNRVFQILKHKPYPPAKAKVLIRETISGHFHISYLGENVKFVRGSTF